MFVTAKKCVFQRENYIAFNANIKSKCSIEFDRRCTSVGKLSKNSCEEKHSICGFYPYISNHSTVRLSPSNYLIYTCDEGYRFPRGERSRRFFCKYNTWAPEIDDDMHCKGLEFTNIS